MLEGEYVQLENLQPGIRVDGIVPGQAITVIAAQWHGGAMVELTFRTQDGVDQQVLSRSDEARLQVAGSGSRAFDADARAFKLAAEAQRIKLAGLFDPMLAVSTSDVQPLPHQIRAVYGELLPRSPLRFLLADDPGAGKTIMAGLYIKELRLREDVRRCLVVAPGGLVGQWQDELFLKFGLHFDLLTPDLLDSQPHRNPFDTQPLLIARMDQLSRNEGLQRQLRDTEWDLIVIDEAHRMGVHYFGGKLEKTKRFQLGEMLGTITRHLLLMTATPHAGKEEDFQAFLTLLDADRFEGRGSQSVDTDGIMRRMVKEDLLTFEGRKLFPERIAETVPYTLTAQEYELYEAVTEYVREGMNRAEQLGGKRRNTVGFALTVLQRRLASSPEAIHESLRRRIARLQRKRAEVLHGARPQQAPDVDTEAIDGDEYGAEQLELLEDELLDEATAARTVQELDAELMELEQLVRMAAAVRASGMDRKWTELAQILEDHVLSPDGDEAPRKLIVFTEHRDTLSYLARRVGDLTGRPDAVLRIHGGVPRQERRRITDEFTSNPDAQFLLATDAAGEGLNLQAAHLMVNYDLPWNPNRIEQRFGRIHRIGQTEVCRLWNVVAVNTREGAVFTRLLQKLDQMRTTYGGKVFDVLGEAFDETPLRDLLIDAIQYGERDDVRARMEEVIDTSVGDGLAELVSQRALAADHIADAELHELGALMDDARARRLHPHYIESAFTTAFAELGGRIVRKGDGRYAIPNVPAAVRASANGTAAARYDNVAFGVDTENRVGTPGTDLLVPGHPLHDAVMDQILDRHRGALNNGTVLVSDKVDEPSLLVGVVEEVNDATGTSVARRFRYVFATGDGTITPAGPAPYLDCFEAPAGAAVEGARRLPWLSDAEQQARSWIIADRSSSYLDDVAPRRTAELCRTRELVEHRLRSETSRLLKEAAAASERELAGERPRASSESLHRKAVELDRRLRERLEHIEQQLRISARPPTLAATALVLPVTVLDDPSTPDARMRAMATRDGHQRGVELVMAAERALGRTPVEQPRHGQGFDILSTDAQGVVLRIVVKAGEPGSADFFVSHNEVMLGKNAAPRHRLALVALDPRGSEFDEVRYLDAPFGETAVGGVDVPGVRGDWARTWKRGRAPF